MSKDQRNKHNFTSRIKCFTHYCIARQFGPAKAPPPPLNPDIRPLGRLETAICPMCPNQNIADIGVSQGSFRVYSSTTQTFAERVLSQQRRY